MDWTRILTSSVGVFSSCEGVVSVFFGGELTLSLVLVSRTAEHIPPLSVFIFSHLKVFYIHVHSNEFSSIILTPPLKSRDFPPRFPLQPDILKHHNPINSRRYLTAPNTRRLLIRINLRKYESQFFSICLS